MTPDSNKDFRPIAFVLDVDGVMTPGRFPYTVDGKSFKEFGPDDHDGLLLVKERLPVHFVTGDRKGFAISRKRIVEDMKFPLELVSTIDRIAWIAERWDPRSVIYMGDGLLDVAIFVAVGYSICPSDGFYLARSTASHVTQHGGGNRAVAEACVHVLDRFFGPFNPLMAPRMMQGGEWAIKAP